MEIEEKTGVAQSVPGEGEATHGATTTKLPESVEETDELALNDFLVLVVDDMVDNAVVLSLDLQQEGYRVVTASDGEQAISVATKTYPDIILMDIGMPELDGLEAARRIRETDALRSVPIIAVTAFGTGGFQRAARDAGFDGYLIKPIEFDKLHQLMRRLLPLKK